MSNDDSLYLGHMLDTAREALSRIQGKTRDDYDENRDLRLALTYLLQIIGEAARRVSPEFRQAHAHIPWKAIVGMRHKVVHDYMNVDEDIVWDTVSEELGPLILELEKILPPEIKQPVVK